MNEMSSLFKEVKMSFTGLCNDTAESCTICPVISDANDVIELWECADVHLKLALLRTGI